MDLGLELAGWTPTWQVEINKYRRRVLERHWPNVKRFEDVRAVDPGRLAPVDLIAAGFPCQPFSVAGRNRGEADERNLWPETIRVIRGVRPQLALLENVPGLLAHSYFGTILGDLAEAGYDAEWCCIRASDFGASHRRERLFIVANRNIKHSDLQQWSERAESDRESNNVADTRHAGRSGRLSDVEGGEGEPRREPTSQDGDVADTEETGQQVGRFGSGDATTLPRPEQHSFPPGPDDLDTWARVLAEMPSLEPAVCRVAARVPHRVDRLAALGDAVVPTVAQWIGSRMQWKLQNSSRPSGLRK
jgi:DNA (cytosine-5)-methyltransferase 1